MTITANGAIENAAPGGSPEPVDPTERPDVDPTPVPDPGLGDDVPEVDPPADPL